MVARCDRVYSIRDGKIFCEIILKMEDEKRISHEERVTMHELY